MNQEFKIEGSLFSTRWYLYGRTKWYSSWNLIRVFDNYESALKEMKRLEKIANG